jgi:SAM-dependent methyltransferase
VKQTVIAIRLAVVCPAAYRIDSRTAAAPPKTAIARNTVPVTSSHNWCAARPNDRAVVRAPLITALTVRLRDACCPATRATTPSFRMAETLFTASILTACGDTMTQPIRRRTVPAPQASKGLAEVMSTVSADLAQLKSGMKAVWMAGDFGQIANFSAGEAESFVRRLEIKAGTSLLDVACGTGNTALPSAKAGAKVTGIDIAPNLLEQARKRAVAEKLDIRFEEGDAEDLPYPDRSFDVVLSMFGAMFAPRPERVASELLRVCKPYGLVAMANWTPQGFVGKTFRATAELVPPPPGVPPPVLWGDESTVRRRLGHGSAQISCIRRKMQMAFPFPPKETLDFFRRYFGPTKTAFSRLDADGQATLAARLESLWLENNTAKDGTTAIEAEYLEVRAVRA